MVVLTNFMPSQKRSLHSLEDLKVASQSRRRHPETQILSSLWEIGKVRMILTLILRKELNEAEKTLGAYWKDRQKRNVSKPMNGVTEKGGKNNFDTYKNRVMRNL